MSEINNIGLNSNERILQGNMENGQIGSVTSSDTSINAVQNELNKQLMVVLSKIQIGDIVKGKLLQLEGQTRLQLQNGMQLSAQCLEEVVSDKLQDFLVIGKSRQHLDLQLVKPSTTIEGGLLVDQAALELGLKPNEATREAITKFMAKQLPLAKQQLVQVLQFAKALDIPPEATTNLLSHQHILLEEEAQLMATFKGNEGEWIESELLAVLEHLPEDQKGSFIRSFTQLFEPKEILKHLQHQGILKESADFIYPTPQEEGTLLVKENEIEGQKDRLLDQRAPLSPIEEETLVREYLANRPLKEIKKLFRSMVKERITLQLDKGNELHEVEKLSRSAEMIKKVAEQIKQADLEGVDQSKLQQLEKMGEVVEKYNMEAQYFCFPMQVKGKNAEGELYFFKPKKNKKHAENGMYIVLALTMPHLNKIEVHVKEQGEKVNLRLKVKEPMIKALIESHQSDLKKLMDETAFTLDNMSCELMEDGEKTPTFSKIQSMTRLDTKI